MTGCFFLLLCGVLLCFCASVVAFSCAPSDAMTYDEIPNNPMTGVGCRDYGATWLPRSLREVGKM